MKFQEAVAHAERALAASEWSESEFALIDIQSLKTLTMSGPIYCKECKHWPYRGIPYGENSYAISMYSWCWDFNGNEFCSKAEAK